MKSKENKIQKKEIIIWGQNNGSGNSGKEYMPNHSKKITMMAKWRVQEEHCEFRDNVDFVQHCVLTAQH